MKRLADALASARESGRLAFLPCVTAGDPDAETSLEMALTLAREGADLLGLDVPFSDPVGESDLLRRAGRRAIAGGMNLGRGLERVLSPDVRRLLVRGSDVDPGVVVVVRGQDHFEENSLLGVLFLFGFLGCLFGRGLRAEARRHHREPAVLVVRRAELHEKTR